MTPSKFLAPHTSFESIRKQAKKLARQFAAGDREALARVHAQLPAPALPFPLRDAQLVLAREYGFAGWKDLRMAVLRQEGKGLEWAGAEAKRAIHDNKVEELARLLEQYPALLSWRDDSGKSLLGFAADSFGDSGDSYREQRFTRIESAEILLDAGAKLEPSIWQGAIQARARGVLHLFFRKGVLPRNLDTLAALGDYDGVREFLPGADAARVIAAFVTACRFQHKQVAEPLLHRAIELDPALGEQVEKWRGRSGFIGYLAEHKWYGTAWLSVVTNELEAAMHKNDLEQFNRWLEQNPDLFTSNLSLLVRLIEVASYNNRGPFIARLLEFAPAIRAQRPPSAAVQFALEYGNSHLIPLLTPIWPLPGDLPHAAGVGDFARVRTWFDDAGRPRLGNIHQHYPINNPSALRNLHWNPPNAQHILDVALAWAGMNRHFEIADFLLKRGADINTGWSTHEPASILHECAVHAKYETAQFLIDRGIDMTICDYRWDATAKGWARYAAKDEKMAELLAHAEAERSHK